jgi:hypothetical protein
MTTATTSPAGGLPPAEAARYVRRHPLGLPAGSVRALLALMVFGIIWAMLLLPERDGKEIRIPLYLEYLMFLILGSYFATRGHATAPAGVRTAHPLHLPRGSLRLLMMAGFAAAFGWGLYQNPDLVHRLNPISPGGGDPVQVYLPLVILGAFFLGVVVNRLALWFLADPIGGLPAWYQDLQAWVSLLAVLGLGLETILRLVVYPGSGAESPFDWPRWEACLAAVVAFYFGARSGS